MAIPIFSQFRNCRGRGNKAGLVWLLSISHYFQNYSLLQYVFNAMAPTLCSSSIQQLNMKVYQQCGSLMFFSSLACRGRSSLPRKLINTRWVDSMVWRTVSRLLKKSLYFILQLIKDPISTKINRQQIYFDDVFICHYHSKKWENIHRDEQQLVLLS